MKYNIQQLINSTQENDYIFFWGHQPSKDGTITKSCFSQWWISSFIVESVEYKTSEHWMMAQKALLFDDKEIYYQILKTNLPAEVKKSGRAIINYDDSIWVENRFKIVREGNYHKFSQNEELKAFLLSTGNTVIVEASPVDSIWGIGMASDDVNILTPEKWKGLNLLGFALMEVRDELKNVQAKFQN